MSIDLKQDPQSRKFSAPMNNKSWMFLLIISSAFLSIFTVYDQVFHRTGLGYIWDEQLRFHQWVIEGTSVNPWQYRILAPYFIELTRSVFEFLDIGFSYARVFFGIRIIQNFLIFYLFAIYITRMKVNRKLTLLGLAILAWGFTYSGYASGLAFDTYFDILFYLLTVLLILDRKYIWLIPLSIIAAFNRETGILIPILLLISQYQPNLSNFVRRREFRIGAAGLLLFVMIFVALRIWYGPREFLKDFPPGISLLKYNITNLYSYFSIFATYSIIPVLALIHYKKWPEMLQRFFWIMMPLWVGIHLFTSVIAEARLFLVPYIIILLPAALMTSSFGIAQALESRSE